MQQTSNIISKKIKLRSKGIECDRSAEKASKEKTTLGMLFCVCLTEKRELIFSWLFKL